MLKLTRLNNQPVVVNPDHIFAIDASPDTTLRLVGGERILVRETIDELIELVIAFRRRVGDPSANGASATAAYVASLTDRQDGDVEGGE